MPSNTLAVTPSYRFNDRRGTAKPWAYAARSNSLFQAAKTDEKVRDVPQLDRDTHRNLTELGRRKLMDSGRWLYSNYSPVAGAVDEQATLCTENFQPQFWGEDREWGNEAEAFLLEYGRVCDVAGPPFDEEDYKRALVVAGIRDGDIGTILTETEDGFPQIQVIPAHRIGSRRFQTEHTVSGGPFDGARVIDGVIVNDARRAIGYRVYDEDDANPVDVPAANMFLSFIPKWADQVRGLPELASGAFDWQGMRSSREYEIAAQAAASTIGILETNESGGMDPTKSLVKTASTNNTDGTKATAAVESLNGLSWRYFRAGSGSKLEAFTYDRPGANVVAYQENVMRDALMALGWSYFFAVDPTKAGGATMRVVVEKINRVIRLKQRMVAKALRRVHGYAISKAIKKGLLRPSDEWWKWEYQTSAEITADRKYDSQVDIDEIAAGITTRKRACAKRGEYWEDVDDQRIAEGRRLVDKVKQAFNVDITEEVARSMAGPAGQAKTAPPPEDPEPEKDKEKAGDGKDKENKE